MNSQRTRKQLPCEQLAAQIAIINSDPVVSEQLRRLYTDLDYGAAVLTSVQETMEGIAAGAVDLLVTDVDLSNEDGLAFIGEVRRSHSDVPIIVITGDKDIELAVKVLKLGVSDYIGLPFNAEAIEESTRLALEKAQVAIELRHMRRTFKESFEFVGMLSKTPEMHRVFETIRMVSGMDVTVLIDGETGTGKELVARAIHERSPRRDGKLVAINCAGVPESLLESELFGYEKGAFTGADHARAGMIELAHGGTLFLDEIESMPLSMQGKLLRVLEDRKVQRLGGNKAHHIDMRVIAATNVAAGDLVAQGKMRPDFYYRINVVGIHLMPLRQRGGDIPLLVQNFLLRHPFARQKAVTGISNAAMTQLMNHSWPGNIRELQNVLEKAVVLCASPVIEKLDLPDAVAPSQKLQERVTNVGSFSQWMREQEKKYLTQQLATFQGRLEETAVNSGMCVRTLFRKMRQYGLDKKQFRSSLHEAPASRTQPALSRNKRFSEPASKLRTPSHRASRPPA